MRERQAQTEFDVVQHFAGLRVLVIGDAMLDRFVEGTATRICKEAPVPVVQKQAEQSCPGGAANTATNLSALGADVRFWGLRYPARRPCPAPLPGESARRHPRGRYQQ